MKQTRTTKKAHKKQQEEFDRRVERDSAFLDALIETGIKFTKQAYEELTKPPQEEKPPEPVSARDRLPKWML